MADDVELLLDPASDLVLHGDWDALEAEGLPNQGRHQSFSNAPHITLAAAPRIDDRFDVDLAAAVEGDALNLVTAGLLVFPGRRKFVLARHVVAGEELARLHRRVWSVLHEVADPVPTTVPHGWTPHITISHGLTAEQLAAAFVILKDRRVGQLTGGIIRRWDAKEKRLVALGGGGLRWPDQAHSGH